MILITLRPLRDLPLRPLREPKSSLSKEAKKRGDSKTVLVKYVESENPEGGDIMVNIRTQI